MAMAKAWNGLIVALAVSLPLAPALPDEGGDGQERPCPRKPARDHPVGGVTVVKDGRPPCRIVFRKTGIRLEAVADGSRPDPGMTVLQDSKGRFYSANPPGGEPVIVVWDPQGKYLTSFGREGEGPGEFSARGGLTLYMDHENQLHVRDGAGSWSVFSRDHKFLRRVPIRVGGMLSDARTTVILDGGQAVTGDDYNSGRRNYFRILNPDGTLDRAFGPVSDELAQDRTRPLERLIAYRGGDTFWVGPVEGEGYVLEEWGVDGELRRTLRRDVSWRGWSEDSRSAPDRLTRLQIDDSGILYVLASHAGEKYSKALEKYRHRVLSESHRRENMDAARAELEALMNEHMEIVAEMIDTRSGELLASESYSLSTLEEIPFPRPGLFLLPGVMRGFIPKLGEDGLPLVDIIDVELVAR